jgi:flagellar biosynthetic protein FliQ
MNPQDAIDLGREALVIATLISAPVLIAGMLVGLIVGLIQALTQIQEQMRLMSASARRTYLYVA